MVPNVGVSDWTNHRVNPVPAVVLKTGKARVTEIVRRFIVQSNNTRSGDDLRIGRGIQEGQNGTSPIGIQKQPLPESKPLASISNDAWSDSEDH